MANEQFKVLYSVVGRLGHALKHMSVLILGVKFKKLPSMSQFTNQHYCLSKNYC